MPPRSTATASGWRVVRAACAWLVLAAACPPAPVHGDDDLATFVTSDAYRAQVNVALREARATATVVQEGKPDRNVDFLIDGSTAVHKQSLVQGLPFSVVVRLASPKDVEAIRVFSGNPDYAANPSSECAIRSCRVSVERGGVWRPAPADAQTLPTYRELKAKGLHTLHAVLPCQQAGVTAIKLEVLASTDTGKRVNSDKPLPPEARVCYLREIEVFSTERIAVPRPLPMQAIVDAEFQLPVYVDQPAAEMVLEPRALLANNAKVCVDLFEGYGKNRLLTSPIAVCRPAERAAVTIPLTGLATGLYRAEVYSPERRDVFLTRWLRIQRPAAPSRPSEPLDIRGRKLLFLDDHYLQSRTGFRFEKQQAEALPVLHKNVEPGYVINSAQSFFRGTDGRFYYRFQSLPIEGQSVIGFVKSDAVTKRSTAVSNDLRTWTILVGSQGQPAPTKTSLFASDRAIGRVDWGKVRQCRVYDAARDGKIPLQEVKLVFTGYEKTRWADREIAANRIYPVWQKSPNEALLLQAEPLMQHHMASADDEAPGDWGDYNDNWGGQWLSADGRTLYFMVARLVPRKRPFTIRYDNLLNAVRLFVLWKTHDGLHWEHSFVAPPQTSDPPGWQHYNLSHLPYAGADARIGFLFPYDCLRQQVYVDLVYSYDDENWQRPGPLGKFAPNGPMGSFSFGYMSCWPGQTVEKDGFCYTAMLNCYSLPHFGYRWAFSKEPPSGALLEKQFAGSGIEQWPYWRELGSFAAMYEKLKIRPEVPYRTFGLLKYRTDGFVAMKAGEDPATAVTCRLRGKGRLTVNARCAAGGYLKIELLGADGKPLSDYGGAQAAQVEGDHTAAPVVWKSGSLPTTPDADDYRLRIEARQTELFSISFQ